MTAPCAIAVALALALQPAGPSPRDPEPAPAVVAPADAAPARVAPSAEAAPTPTATEPSSTGGGASAPPSPEPAPPADDDADRAAADLEGRSSAPSGTPVPSRMRPLQRGGWWSLAGAAAFATVAGVFSSLARGQEDRLITLASEIDPQTGSFPQYATVQDDYERALDKGRTFARTSQALAGVAGAFLVAGLVLLFVDARRQAKLEGAAGDTARRRLPRRRRRLSVGRRGIMEVRF